MAALLVPLTPTSVSAWEQDFHYVLTYWLAIQAGFSPADAGRIADGNQSYDDSAHAGAIFSVILAAVMGDEGAALSVRDKHFPSTAPIPSPPQVRVVTPNSAAARRAVNALLVAAASPDTPIDLFELGGALHPLQDSWSHQGVPDVPYGLRPTLAFGHPAARGGWKRHDADHTHLHPDDASMAAEKTYEVFVLYLKQRPKDRFTKGVSWASIRDTVRAFAVAASREQKDAWAFKYMRDQSVRLTAVNRLSIPYGSSRQPTALDVNVGQMPPPSYGLGGTPKVDEATLVSLNASAQRFLDAWFSEQNLALSIGFFDLAAINEQLKAAVAPAEPPRAADWLSRFLVSHLILDHAAVNAVGHADPADPQTDTLPTTVLRDGPFRAGAPIKVTVSRDAFVPIPTRTAGESQRFIMTLEGAVHDAIALVWERRGGNEWQIVEAVTVVG